MGNLMSYSGIVTKIHAMKAKLLTEQDFETISGFGNVPEVIEYLKNTPAYAEYIGQMDISLYHRGNVEKILYQSLYDDYSRIFRFSGMKQKKFLKEYWKRYEVDLINYCFRIVFNHYDVPFDVEYKKRFFDRYSQISVDRLITSRNTEELVENLRDTEYYAPLKRISEYEHATLFDFDLALVLYYYSTMWKKGKRLLDGKEKEIFQRDFGSRVDMLNIQWIYRAKKYYHMLPPDIYSLTLPFHYRLTVEEFRGLVEAPTVEELRHKMEETYYARKYHFDDERTMEHRCAEIMRHLYTVDWRNNPYSIASINTYLFLKEEEINKLTTALECIRYGLSRAETLAYLGGVVQ